MYIKNLFIQKPKNTGFYYKLSSILNLHNLVFIIKNSVTTTMKQIHMASVSVTTIVFWGWWEHLGVYSHDKTMVYNAVLFCSL